MRKLTNILSMILTLASVCSCHEIEPSYRIQPGDPLPEFSVQMNDGKTVRRSDLSSGEALVVFFHTLCPDCVIELGTLQPFYDKYGDSVKIILISRAEGADSINAYWREHSYTMPFSAQDDRTVYEKFSNIGIPLAVLVENGTVTGVWDDKNMFDEQGYLSTKKQSK